MKIKIIKSPKLFQKKKFFFQKLFRGLFFNTIPFPGVISDCFSNT